MSLTDQLLSRYDLPYEDAEFTYAAAWGARRYHSEPENMTALLDKLYMRVSTDLMHVGVVNHTYEGFSFWGALRPDVSDDRFRSTAMQLGAVVLKHDTDRELILYMLDTRGRTPSKLLTIQPEVITQLLRQESPPLVGYQVRICTQRMRHDLAFWLGVARYRFLRVASPEIIPDPGTDDLLWIPSEAVLRYVVQQLGFRPTLAEWRSVLGDLAAPYSDTTLLSSP